MHESTRKPTEYLKDFAKKLRRRLRSKWFDVVREIKYRGGFTRYYGDWFSHEGMLADTPRVEAYAKAIKRFVTPGSTVLDLGTGTGILACLAAKAGARKVYAVERTDIIKVARLIASRNGFFNIEFLNIHSKKVSIPDRVDFIVHEQMAYMIDEENMIANILDMRDRILKPGGRILPNAFKVFVEPVQLKPEGAVPFLWEQKINGIDFSCTKCLMPELPNKSRYIGIKYYQVESILSEPEALFDFDLETMPPDAIPEKFIYRRRIAKPGRFDGLCFYFVASFGDGIELDTNPIAPGRPYHWSNKLYRVEGRQVTKGDIIKFELTIGDLRDAHTWVWRPND